jgi:hypothetical protein
MEDSKTKDISDALPPSESSSEDETPIAVPSGKELTYEYSQYSSWLEFSLILILLLELDHS